MELRQYYMRTVSVKDWAIQQIYEKIRIRREQLCNELAVKQVMMETQKCLKRIERIWDNVTLFKNKNNGYVTRTLFKNSANKLVEMQTILNAIARRPVTLKSNVIKLKIGKGLRGNCLMKPEGNNIFLVSNDEWYFVFRGLLMGYYDARKNKGTRYAIRK